MDQNEFDEIRLHDEGGNLPTYFNGKPVLRIEMPPDTSRGAPPTRGWRLLTVEGTQDAPTPVFASPAEDGSDDWWIVYLTAEKEGWRGITTWPVGVTPAASQAAHEFTLAWPSNSLNLALAQQLAEIKVRINRVNGGSIDPMAIEKTHVVGRLAHARDGTWLPQPSEVVFSGFGPPIELDEQGYGWLPVRWLPDLTSIEPGEYTATAVLLGSGLVTAPAHVLVADAARTDVLGKDNSS
ncbi:hypothetical protein [Nocardioides sp. InS609-2]|uniref:hypothetical protein n=1 Tax=Nocardioides sp. InS609-2 TaxID=2760705 RepID=UPI0020BFA525|nr:hypothetical protein [Nocardioides sp. InS609-2]